MESSTYRRSRRPVSLLLAGGGRWCVDAPSTDGKGRNRKGGEKGQAMTIARGAPIALFRLIFSVDISASFYARKCERPLGVGLSVVTASITGKSINEEEEGEGGGREGGKKRRENDSRGDSASVKREPNSTNLSRVCDRCFYD